MALFRRFSDGVWSFLSPQRSNASRLPHDQLVANGETPSRGTKKDAAGSSKLDIEQETPDGKRKRSSQHGPHANKRMKTENGDGRDVHDANQDESFDDDEDSLDENGDENDFSPIALSHDLSANLDDSIVVDEEEYEREASSRRKIINLPEEAIARGVSTEELTEAGWNDDHIQLVQKIAMRGYEPLLPAYYKWDYRFMPDGLFSEDDDAFIGSVRKQHYHSIKALERLFDTGGRARDRLHSRNSRGPEDIVRRNLEDYMKWAYEDAGLGAKSIIPNLVVHARSADTPSSMLQEQARRKLAKLYARYQGAFQIQQSIENSPRPGSINLAYEIPQLYAVIASSTVVVLVAYRPDTEQEIRPVVFFDFRNKNYDVWNALALAIVVNHSRNVHLRLAADTGLGEFENSTELEQTVDDDPDL